VSQTRRQFIQTSTLAGLGVLAARKLAWAFGNSPITIRKFVKRLPSLGLNPLPANEDGLYVPVAQSMARTIRPKRGPAYNVDYYKFQIAPYKQQLHSDLPGPARFYGYQDITPTSLGRPGRTPDAKYLGGVIIAKSGTPVQLTFVNKLPNDHILPVDTTEPVSGVGFGRPNRAAVHFHGGDVPWISDGGPFDWFSSVYDPKGTRYGSSFLNNVIPGASGGDGEAEYYYPMAQTARLAWYHDHAFGLTRLNAYAGIASGLLIVDDFEESLINSGILPSLPGYLRYGIPLVIQDKTFWDPASDRHYPAGDHAGDLWYPWQYESDRWEVGAFDRGKNPAKLPVSTVPEFFADTMLVNGCPYPYLPVEPRHYRFRILNGSQGRFFNLQLYYAKSDHLPNPNSGEADLKKPGPRIIQIGTEGGFLRFPVVLNDPPVRIKFDTKGSPETNPTYGNAIAYNLLLGPAERADVVIDFSDCPVGSNLILYTDSPAPFPGGDPLNDYLTSNPDPNGPPVATPPGYGPNTRTIMQFRVSPFNTLGQGRKPDPAVLDEVEKLALLKHGPNPFAGVDQFDLGSLRNLDVTERWLSLNEDFDEYGRLLQRLGTLTSTTPTQAGSGNWLGMPLEAAPTEIVNEGDLEVWHIVNTTADTHPMHFHLVNVQVVQRQAFDSLSFLPGNAPALLGKPRPPDANEMGWKETVRMNPSEVTSVVMRFNIAKVPFDVPNSPRLAAFTPPIHGAEYVWHCHILEHEEHDMMRPMVVIPNK
jgi:spore coat protein A